MKRLAAERDIMRNYRMYMSVWVWAVPLALLTALAGSARAADIPSGRTLAHKLCVNCHVVAPGEAAIQVNPGIPSFAAVAEKPGQTADKIQNFLIDPHPPMPQLQLTNIERANLAAYILSLKD